MEIAPFAAQGKHNAQVARDLLTSPLTAENHLKHTYIKLQVGSRAELAHVLQGLVD
jgi:DNA-binding CsgD family transcriptional regulator